MGPRAGDHDPCVTLPHDDDEEDEGDDDDDDDEDDDDDDEDDDDDDDDDGDDDDDACGPSHCGLRWSSLLGHHPCEECAKKELGATILVRSVPKLVGSHDPCQRCAENGSPN